VTERMVTDIALAAVLIVVVICLTFVCWLLFKD
jgi:hypothetical protein